MPRQASFSASMTRLSDVNCSPNWSCISRAMRRRSSSCAKTRRREQLGARPLGLGALALGQIEVGADDADDGAAGLAADGEAARQHVDVVAVLVAQAELAFVDAARRARRSR